MVILNTDIMSDASEVVHYDDAGIPLYIRRAPLSAYPNYRAAAHWHEDLEFIAIKEGEMHYAVNGQTILLQRGDALFVNARQLHYGYGTPGKECIFLCILIHPSLLAGGCSLLQKELSPMLDDPSFPCWHFGADGEKESRAARMLGGIVRAKEDASCGYRLRAVGILSELAGDLLDLWHAGKRPGESPAASPDPDLELARRMVAFIEEHYAADLSLDEIAQSASLSRSTCCRLFRRYVHSSPLAFLNSYRLQEACVLLRSTDRTITDISSSCGFNHPSYFTHLFGRCYGSTPQAYRRAQREPSAAPSSAEDGPAPGAPRPV